MEIDNQDALVTDNRDILDTHSKFMIQCVTRLKGVDYKVYKYLTHLSIMYNDSDVIGQLKVYNGKLSSNIINVIHSNEKLAFINDSRRIYDILSKRHNWSTQDLYAIAYIRYVGNSYTRIRNTAMYLALVSVYNSLCETDKQEEVIHEKIDLETNVLYTDHIKDQLMETRKIVAAVAEHMNKVSDKLYTEYVYYYIRSLILYAYDIHRRESYIEEVHMRAYEIFDNKAHYDSAKSIDMHIKEEKWDPKGYMNS